ncbi:MAG: vWA domain-containing protein [Bacteroidia bacterium]
MKLPFHIEIFANPLAFVLLLFVPIFLYWYWKVYDKKRLMIPLSVRVQQLTGIKSNGLWLRHLPLFFQLVGLILFILALARPQDAINIKERKTEGMDILLLLDVSGSMEATDFPPNRLAVAKQNAIDFVKGRVGDRIGVVLFSEQAFSLVPLTLDYEWLCKSVQNINPALLPKQGTAIGSAIAVGINRLKASHAASQVLILFTDGANNRGEIDPISAAKLAAMNQMKMYCIAMAGANEDIDEKGLQRMAKITGGLFFKANNPQKLKQIFTEISKLEKVEIRDDVYRDVTDLYPGFIKVGIFSFLIAYFIMLTYAYNPLEQ